MRDEQAGERPQEEERPWCVRHGSAGEPAPGQGGQREQHENETNAIEVCEFMAEPAISSKTYSHCEQRTI